jgi:hypothetical protein
MADDQIQDGVYHDVPAVVTIQDGKATVELLQDFGLEPGQMIPLKSNTGTIRIVAAKPSAHLTASLQTNGHGII